MKIMIKAANKDKIEAALKVANGKACEHTYTAYHELIEIARNAEIKLSRFGLSKRDAVGAIAYARSGAHLPTSYKYPRVVTFVTLRRCTSGWALVRVSTGSARNESRALLLALTSVQDQLAVANLRRSYSVVAVAPAIANAR